MQSQIEKYAKDTLRSTIIALPHEDLVDRHIALLKKFGELNKGNKIQITSDTVNAQLYIKEDVKDIISLGERLINAANNQNYPIVTLSALTNFINAINAFADKHTFKI